MKREDLGFTIEDRGSVMVLQYNSGGCHPANDNEIAMWNLIGQLEEHCAVQEDFIKQYQNAGKYAEFFHAKSPDLPLSPEEAMRIGEIVKANAGVSVVFASSEGTLDGNHRKSDSFSVIKTKK